ncbi:MAG: GTPase HflX [Gammaproteobacteria bacterium]|nr:GTPase HflX [Gammaproteobacteria bacterium]
MFERPRSGERALLVHMGIGQGVAEDVQEEFEELARSAGAEPLATFSCIRQRPDPRFFIGTGKADELRAAVKDLDAELVLLNHALSPSQERNLERHLECRVLDRSGLILDIFAQRARSHEGKLQVELAQLRHLATRLVRGWTHLERQKGGIGLRGPGETQLETDRRLLNNRIRTLGQRLEQVDKQREQGRRTRQKAEVPTISLVGYTNAGKSTLFNYLTNSEVYAADKLFATLDPTLRKLELAPGLETVLADTVGFIRDLPHELVAAFKSTLIETRDATLLLHVVDAHDPERRARIEQVDEVLKEIGAEDVEQLLVYNKIDLSGDEARLERDSQGRARRVFISSVTGAGIDLLLQALHERLGGELLRGQLTLGSGEGRIRARLYELAAVIAETELEEGGWSLELVIPRRKLARLVSKEGLDPARFDLLPCSLDASFIQSEVPASSA